MNPRFLLLSLACAATVACSSTTAPQAPSAPVPEPPGSAAPVEAGPLALLVTSDNWGEYAPCGCRDFPSGGLGRRATVIRQRRLGGPVLVVDAGDALFRDDYRQPSDNLREQARLVLRSMAAMGVGAMNVGDRDLAGGLDWLVAQAAEARVPLVSANLVRADGSRPFAPSQLLTAGGRRVGVIGVWGEGRLPDGLQAEDAAAAAGAEAKRLRERGAEVVVALVHGKDRSINAVASAGGIDLVIPSHEGTSVQPYLPTADGAWVLGAGERGRAVLAIDLELDGEGPLVDGQLAERLESERDYVKRRLELDQFPELGSHPRARDLVADRRAHLERRLAELDEEIARARKNEGRRFRAQSIRLGDAIADDEAIAKEVASFRDRVAAD